MLTCTLPNTRPDAKEWHEPAPTWAMLHRADTGDLKVAERAFAAALSAARAPITPRSVADRFREHSETWQRETMHMSSPMQRMEHQTIADRLSTPEKIVKKGYINKTLDAIQWKRDMISRKELRTWALENGFDKVEDANQSWQSEQEHLRYQGE